MQLVITLDLGNAATRHDDGELDTRAVAELVTEAVKPLAEGFWLGPDSISYIRDINGATIGQLTFSSDDD